MSSRSPRAGASDRDTPPPGPGPGGAPRADATDAAIDALVEQAGLTHPDRVIDPVSGTTKADLARYYATVADTLLPHLRDRPITLVRAPGGVRGHTFVQRHIDGAPPPGVRALDPALYPGHPPLLTVDRPEGLLALVQLNVIEFHTQNAALPSLARADRLIFDLDPGDEVDWQVMRDAARSTREWLAGAGLGAFLKTSGGKGLHVVAPIVPAAGWKTVERLCRTLVDHLAEASPDRYAARSGAAHRVGKVFIDYLRNAPGASTVSAWSARARPGLGVSMPLTWDQLDEVRAGGQWTVRDAATSIADGRAAWRDYEDARRPLDRALALLGLTPRDD